jgi:hypothetical protein
MQHEQSTGTQSMMYSEPMSSAPFCSIKEISEKT